MGLPSNSGCVPQNDDRTLGFGGFTVDCGVGWGLSKDIRIGQPEAGHLVMLYIVLDHCLQGAKQVKHV